MLTHVYSYVNKTNSALLPKIYRYFLIVGLALITDCGQLLFVIGKKLCLLSAVAVKKNRSLHD